MSVRILAPAKINLVLEVLGRRADGFHELASVVHTVGLCDELELEPADDVQVRLVGAEVAPEQDLIRRAALALRQALGLSLGARIACVKRIPVASGLGGGSSDAAATLRGLARLWNVEAEAAISRLAPQLGSDVPLFLCPGAALVQGHGDRITPLPAVQRGWAVLVPLAAGLARKTERLFAQLDPAQYSTGARAQALATALRQGSFPPDEALGNVFEPLARALYPGLAALQDGLRVRTGVRFHLSGAGPSLFALCTSEAEAAALACAARALAPSVCPVRLVGAAARVEVAEHGTILA